MRFLAFPVLPIPEIPYGSRKNADSKGAYEGNASRSSCYSHTGKVLLLRQSPLP